VIETRDAPLTRPATGSLDRVTGVIERHRLRSAVVGALALGMPLVVALVALTERPWHPVLDLAMTELRVRDAFGRHTPLIGLPGRIGEYPDQGSHPGPLSFYLVAVTYRALGSSAWAMEVGTVVIHVGAMATTLWLACRRLGWAGLAAAAALLAIVVHGYGQVTLVQPWNPYLPLVAWVLVLVAAWCAVAGDAVALVPLVVAASFCAQTHVPYLPLGVGMVALGFVGAHLRARSLAPDERQRAQRCALVAVGTGVVLWIPPLLDQLTRSPGNIRQLLDHFASPPEDAIGAAEGLRIALRHLDPWTGVVAQLWGEGGFVDDAAAWRGALALAAWAAAAVVAWRIGSRSLRSLHVVVGVALLLGTASAARIFGRPWYYLTLWAWGTTMVALGAIAWSALALWRHVRPDLAVRRLVGITGLAAAGLVTVGTAVSFGVDAEHAEQRLSDAVGALAGPTYDAVADGAGAAVGVDGRYQVRWSDAADIGSPGFGLLLDLERRGLDVAADEYFRVQVTPHRAGPSARADAQLHLATGAYIERWRALPDAVEVATYDPRTDADRAEFAAVRTRLIDRLRDEGLDELVPLVDENLFGISVDVRLSAADHADLARLIELGQPMAVFIAPATADDDPTPP
jgi:hypothetical protein